MLRCVATCFLVLSLVFVPVDRIGAGSTMASSKLLIVHDELPQVEVLASFLIEQGGLDITVVEQSALPEDWSAYRAVIAYIHRVLEVATEKKLIAYAENGGRFIALHHSISSHKARNEFFFDFLGIRLDNPGEARNPVTPGGGYGWRDESLTLVNLNPAHYITSHNVVWGDEIPYTPSDQPSVESLYPSITLHESEVYMNHKFTDGREKTVLMGFKFLDERNGQLFMQDRAGWLKRRGAGEVVYFMPGHAASDFENRSISQMILNAIIWEP